ncbi:hypothetical protein EGY05_13690 [Chryseobacterium arthrosphaerae]|uniref:hypothetical protein n=1 Tax=Chryseobacterium arthrosphaerae TaxID=651561 RepID=UPI000F4E6354|nr:hypothetical protein [Chryseobacterium arthrosphaerae]AYZ12914.1 hypothetical protein EGY05_13690 [Chryseobacterium arthrosphaerae]
MWTKNVKKYGSGKQELQVSFRVTNLCESNLEADSFIISFKDELRKIKKESCYVAEWLYRAEKIDENTIEIWKLKADSDKNYLMFILTKGPNTPDPFAHLFK